jgi:hypothetical protein
MANRLEIKWALMVAAAKRGAKAQGYELERVPGRGLSNIWTISKDGKTQRAAIRTTRDRWIAFGRLAKQAKWKTLDEVDTVIVATVDSKEKPENIEVFIFPADEVRKRFDASYAARVNAKIVINHDFGIWVNLDLDKRNMPIAVGSGIIERQKPVAIFSINKLLAENAGNVQANEDAEEAEALERTEATEPPRFTTIAQVMAWAREQVAELAEIRIEAVKLDLKLEY